VYYAGMKKLALFFLSLNLIFLPCFADNFYENYTASNGRNVFIYHIPDDVENESQNVSSLDNSIENEQEDIISDDVTADTSRKTYKEINDEDDILDNDYDDVEDMYSYVLKGYAEYNEEDANAVPLEISDDEILVLFTDTPGYNGEIYFQGLKQSPSLISNNIYKMYNGSEYSIAPISTSTSKSLGGFSIGTTYSQGIDYGELEQSSGIFTKYQYKKFALSTSYAKTVNTTNNNYNDNFYIIPELKLNQYFTLKNVFSADTVRKRKKAEVVISVNPFGRKDSDRLRFEIGASETYDEMNNFLKGQFKFSTNYKF
jgi:hypothetical protein